MDFLFWSLLFHHDDSDEETKVLATYRQFILSLSRFFQFGAKIQGLSSVWLLCALNRIFDKTHCRAGALRGSPLSRSALTL